MSPTSSNPESLLLVRSSLEMAALLKRLHPASHRALSEIEEQVRRGGQLLLDAGSTPRARAALEIIHRARLQLEQFEQNFEQDQTRLAA